MNLQKLKKKIAMALATGFVAGTAFAPLGMPVAEADAATTAISALGWLLNMGSAYNMGFNYAIDLGNIASLQDETLAKESADSGGISEDPQDNAIVDRIMNRLIEDGRYSMDARSLPFRWVVTNSNQYNAFCTYNDAINVYHGLLEAEHYDEDMIASVLGHEMSHGLLHHAARHNAQSVMQNYVAINTGIEFNNIAVQKLLEYSNAKNVILPDEYEADEYGFYIAASAGFNPGGAAAENSIFMQTYGDFNKKDFSDFWKPRDHPDSDKRVLKCGKLMTEYSYNHVEVKDWTDVYIDGTLIYRAQPKERPNGTYSAIEVAYLTAGGLAKGFHDNRLFSMWPFRQMNDGSVRYEPTGDAYKWAREAIEETGQAAILEKLVQQAYSNDSKAGTRDEIYAKEVERRSQDKERSERLSELSEEQVGQKNANSHFYVQKGLPYHAIAETNRVINCDSASKVKLATAHNNKGVALERLGNNEAAFNEYNLAISYNPNSSLYLKNRAIIYNKMGKSELALADCNEAIRMNPNDGVAYEVRGLAYDGLGNEESALENFKEAKRLDASINIPEKYAAKMNS